MSSGGTTTVEFVDPQKERELEEEAATKYGVRPMPFQTASRHQAEVETLILISGRIWRPI